MPLRTDSWSDDHAATEADAMASVEWFAVAPTAVLAAPTREGRGLVQSGLEIGALW